MSGAVLILVLLAGFQIKHLIADFLWQTPWMLAGKRHYGHPGGLAHAGLHGLLTAGLVWAFGWSPLTAALTGLAEAAIHYHVDWIKARLTEDRGVGPGDAAFWRAFGIDQVAHQMTYLGIASVLPG